MTFVSNVIILQLNSNIFAIIIQISNTIVTNVTFIRFFQEICYSKRNRYLGVMNMTNPTFRFARLADLQRVVDIYNSTIASRIVTADTEEVSLEERTPWFFEHTETRRPLWVIEVDGVICGWVSFQDFYGRPAYKNTVEVSIYLDAQFRGQGLGKKAIQFALDACPALHIETLLGFIFGHNTPSLALFKHFGFEQWGFYPAVAELDGLKRDLIILGKQI